MCSALVCDFATQKHPIFDARKKKLYSDSHVHSSMCQMENKMWLSIKLHSLNFFFKLQRAILCLFETQDLSAKFGSALECIDQFKLMSQFGSITCFFRMSNLYHLSFTYHWPIGRANQMLYNRKMQPKFHLWKRNNT